MDHTKVMLPEHQHQHIMELSRMGQVEDLKHPIPKVQKVVVKIMDHGVKQKAEE